MNREIENSFIEARPLLHCVGMVLDATRIVSVVILVEMNNSMAHSLIRVATGHGKGKTFFKVREKSGNFVLKN